MRTIPHFSSSSPEIGGAKSVLAWSVVSLSLLESAKSSAEVGSFVTKKDF